MYTRLSKECAESGKLTIDGVFVNEYMPYAPENYVKIYLFGLGAAQGLTEVASADKIASMLGLDEKTVLAAYAYWEDNNLVSVHKGEDGFVEYLPVVPLSKQIRKYSKEKFKGFNDQLHALMPDHNFLPNEYNEYYYLMDTMHIEVEAMLMIIGYCIRIKGKDIHTNYILTVAHNFAAEGRKTYDDVAEKINEYDFQFKDLEAVLKSLKSRRKAEPEDSRLYNKWTKTLGFKSETIIHVAKNVRRGGMETLDRLLSKYGEMKLMDSASIDEYEENRDRMFSLAKEINRCIGVYYEQLDFIIENYIVKWLSLGYTEKTLLSVAKYCGQTNVRTLEEMNGKIKDFYKKGLISASSIENFISQSLESGAILEKLLTDAGVECTVTSVERNSFRTWKDVWNMGDELISLAAKKAVGKSRPVAYMNTILGAWFDRGVKTVAEAQTAATVNETSAPVKTYTAEELNSMFEQLNEGKL